MRGVEAPFQLLVSVFTMILVVAIAYHVYLQALKQKCADRWDRDAEAFATTLMRMATAEPPSSEAVKLHLKCGNSTSHYFYIERKEKAYCLRYCGENMDYCYLLYHVVLDRKGEILYAKPTCLKNFTEYTLHLIEQGSGSDCSGSEFFFDPSHPSAPCNIPNIGTVGKLCSGELQSKLFVTVQIKRTDDGIAVCKVV